MVNRYLQPSADGLRKPTDPQKENGQIINPPRFAEFGGLDAPHRVSQKNPLTISKPNGGRSS
jgi:hypothetical protein